MSFYFVDYFLLFCTLFLVILILTHLGQTFIAVAYATGVAKGCEYGNRLVLPHYTHGVTRWLTSQTKVVRVS